MRKPCRRTLIICSLLISLVFSATFPKPEICQLTECSLNHLTPVRQPLCAATFNMFALKPVTQFRRFPTSLKGRHLFDLFYEPDDHRNCIGLDVMFMLQDDQIFQTLQINVICPSVPGISLIYGSKQVFNSRCIKRISDHAGMAQACNFHAFEQLRFTSITNDTLLVEDLSPHVPRGTRVIFRTTVEAQNRSTECRCRILRRDMTHWKRCIQHHRNQIDNEVQINQSREKVIQEFRIGLAILVASCCFTMCVNCWATRKIAGCECISDVMNA